MSIRESLRAILKGTQGRRTVGLSLTALLLALVSVVGNAYLARPGDPSGWGPLPTQAPTPTPLQADYFLERLKIALLSGDYDEATRLWDIVSTRFPENSEVQREGARLALVQEDLDTAKARAWTAVHIAPKEAANWLIVGVVEQRRGAPKVAQQALEMAQSFDPELAPDLFAARWQAALASEDRDNLTALAQEYIMQNPQDPLSLYYRAESLLTSGAADSALDLLLLSMDQESPGVMWYVLGRVYMAKRADKHAVTALEVAAAAYARGDNSLLLASSDPFHDLNEALGLAYLRTRRCDKTKALLQLLVTPYPDLLPLVEEANRCPQPTPTFTPWLPADWAISPNQRQ